MEKEIIESLKEKNYTLKKVELKKNKYTYITTILNSEKKEFTAKIISTKYFFKKKKLKKRLIDEIKTASQFKNHNLFIQLIDYFYTSNHLIIIYENFYKFSMVQIRKKLNIEMFILLILKDLVDILWILKENKIFHSLLCFDSIYLKNGYFKIGGYEHFLEYGTLNDFYKEEINKKYYPFMSPEFFLKKVIYYPSQIYSLGILLFKFIFETFPIEEKIDEIYHYVEFYSKKKKLVYNEELYCFDPNIYTLIKECLKIDYRERISLRYLKTLVEDYVKEIYSNNLLQLRKTMEVKQNENIYISKNLGNHSQMTKNNRKFSNNSIKGSFIMSSKNSFKSVNIHKKPILLSKNFN